MAKIREVAGEYIEALSPTVETWAMLTVESRGDSYTKPVNWWGSIRRRSPKWESSRNTWELPEERTGNGSSSSVEALGSVPDWELSSEAMQERRVRPNFSIR